MNRNFSELRYNIPLIPDDYACDRCQTHGVKLWRLFQTFASVTPLLCKSCAQRLARCKVENRQIGWYVPAIPIENGENTYWGFTAVPEIAMEWWDRLPEEVDEGNREHHRSTL